MTTHELPLSIPLLTNQLSKIIIKLRQVENQVSYIRALDGCQGLAASLTAQVREVISDLCGLLCSLQNEERKEDTFIRSMTEQERQQYREIDHSLNNALCAVHCAKELRDQLISTARQRFNQD
ncbi:MAG: hypothetical protein ABIC68_07070 [Candidatus Omnitrophota bacterium]